MAPRKRSLYVLNFKLLKKHKTFFIDLNKLLKLIIALLVEISDKVFWSAICIVVDLSLCVSGIIAEYLIVLYQ